MHPSMQHQQQKKEFSITQLFPFGGRGLISMRFQPHFTLCFAKPINSILFQLERPGHHLSIRFASIQSNAQTRHHHPLATDISKYQQTPIAGMDAPVSNMTDARKPTKVFLFANYIKQLSCIR